MSSCEEGGNLMMQPQEYCSCDVCGDSRKSSAGKGKRCSFAPESEQEYSDYSEYTYNTQKSQRSSRNSQFSRSSYSTPGESKANEESEVEALCPPEGPFDCNEQFTPSGMCPPKTAGPLGKRFDCCSKYAPCGHWNNCSDQGHQHDKLFEACDSCDPKAPYGPYGPWNKNGPSKFKIVRQDHIEKLFPKRKRCPQNGLNERLNRPMGKMRPWPLSGSCRYGGRPYGPCRPFGAYRARGPFGIWETAGCDPEIMARPSTPVQPCWKPKKQGYRPCTPCHRPLYRACKGRCVTKGKCDYKKLVYKKCSPVCEEI